MTTHHPKFCIHTVLQLVGLTTEKLLPTALTNKILLYRCMLAGYGKQGIKLEWPTLMY